MASTAELTQVGKREDLADIIAVADAKQTPLKTMIKKGKPLTNMFVEWQLDAYDSARTDGALDGEDVSNYEDAAASRERVGVYAQELRRTAKVNQLAEEVSNVAGINNPDPQGVRGSTEFARAKAKKAVELARDIESTLLSANETAQQSGTTPYKTRGLGAWITNSAQTVQPVPAAFRTPANSVYSGAIGSYTEDSLRTQLQTRWEAVGSADNLIMICGASIKNVISDFARYAPDKSSNLAVRRFNAQPDGKITNSIDVYEGDYGRIEIHLSNYVPTARTAYILDMAGLELRTKGNPEIKDLPDLGGGPRALLRAVIALCVHNPLSHCKVSATT